MFYLVLALIIAALFWMKFGSLLIALIVLCLLIYFGPRR
jgi:hypothetical protein